MGLAPLAAVILRGIAGLYRTLRIEIAGKRGRAPLPTCIFYGYS
jgi:hypothetical protein